MFAPSFILSHTKTSATVIHAWSSSLSFSLFLSLPFSRHLNVRHQIHWDDGTYPIGMLLKLRHVGGRRLPFEIGTSFNLFPINFGLKFLRFATPFQWNSNYVQCEIEILWRHLRTIHVKFKYWNINYSHTQTHTLLTVVACGGPGILHLNACSYQFAANSNAHIAWQRAMVTRCYKWNK